MYNIFKYEFKMNLKSVLLWSISIFVVTILFMTFYPTFSNDMTLLDKMLENYPKEFLKAFGMAGTLSLADVLGYFAFVFTFLQLMLAIQAGNYGFSILSVEEREFTADFLMSKPVSRKDIVTAKFLSSLVSLLICNGVTWISSFISIEIFRSNHSYELKNILILLSSIIIFQLFFLTIGMLISMLVKRVRNVLSFSLGLAFGMYILNTIRAIIGGEILGLVTPFYHLEPNYILEHASYNFPMAIIPIISIILTLIMTYVLYTKRDIDSL